MRSRLGFGVFDERASLPCVCEGFQRENESVNGAKPDAAETLQVWLMWLGPAEDGDPYLSRI